MTTKMVEVWIEQAASEDDGSDGRASVKGVAANDREDLEEEVGGEYHR